MVKYCSHLFLLHVGKSRSCCLFTILWIIPLVPLKDKNLVCCPQNETSLHSRWGRTVPLHTWEQTLETTTLQTRRGRQPPSTDQDDRQLSPMSLNYRRMTSSDLTIKWPTKRMPNCSWVEVHGEQFKTSTYGTGLKCKARKKAFINEKQRGWGLRLININLFSFHYFRVENTGSFFGILTSYNFLQINYNICIWHLGELLSFYS